MDIETNLTMSSEQVKVISEELANVPADKKAAEVAEVSSDHPVFAAIKVCNDDIEKVRNFFEVDGVPVEIEDSIGMTPLMHACWKGHINLAKFLIKQVRTENNPRIMGI